MSEAPVTPAVSPPEVLCRHCGEEIRFIDGAWLDRETHSICADYIGTLHAPRDNDELRKVLGDALDAVAVKRKIAERLVGEIRALTARSEQDRKFGPHACREAKIEAALRAFEELRAALSTPAPRPETEDAPDEELTPHPFNSRTPYEPGDDRDIWCRDCEYHRDHAIHAGAAPRRADAPPPERSRE